MNAKNKRTFNKKALITACNEVRVTQNTVTKEIRTYIGENKKATATWTPKMKKHYQLVDFGKTAIHFINEVTKFMTVKEMNWEIIGGRQEIRLYGDHFTVAGDKYQRMAILANSTDGTRKLMVQAGLLREICTNGMVVTAAGAVNFKVKHLKSNEEVLNVMTFDFGELEKAFKGTEEIAKKLKKAAPVKLSDLRDGIVTKKENGDLRNAKKFLAFAQKLASSKTDRLETLTDKQIKMLSNAEVIEATNKQLNIEIPAYQAFQCYTEAFRSHNSSTIMRENDRMLELVMAQ